MFGRVPPSLERARLIRTSRWGSRGARNQVPFAKAVARPRGWRACPGPSVRRAKLQETKAELRQRMHQTIPDQGHCLRQVVTRLRSQSVAGATAARRAVVELSRGKRVDGGRIFLRIFEPAIL